MSFLITNSRRASPKSSLEGLATTFQTGSVWIGSVVRQVQVDEAASRVRIKIESDGSKTYNLMGSTRLVFVADSVHDRHLFRIPYTLRPFCDDSLVSLLEQGGYTGWSLGGQV